ncbi:MAG: hypothetical protein RLZ22_1025 [Verrucomicrobiota bacterium]|jgi:hypothetical protein
MPARLLTFFLLASLCHANAEVRVWTDEQGRKIEARMIGLEADQVLLELKDGRKVPYPLAKLSQQDADYARDFKASSSGDVNSTQALNFDSEWPERIKFGEDPEISIISEDADQKKFVYESANYRYRSDVRLSNSVVRGFALMFEATYLFCRSLPLALDGGDKTDGKLEIHLFEQYDDYIAAGGMEGSAGVFIGNRALVLVPLDSLGVRKVGSGYMLDRDKSSKTLPHELAHQLTPHPYYAAGSMGWFTEGIAEYVAVTPYRSGAFSVRGNHKDIIDYTTAYGTKNSGGRALGENIHIPDLKGFMLQDYANFMHDPQKNYGCSLLITHYFLQMDGNGDAKRIKSFLKALRDGKTGEDAIAVLLDGRSYEQVGEEITKAWGKRGINFSFGAN